MREKLPSQEIPTELDERAARSRGRRLVAVWNGGVVERPLPARGVLTIGRSETADVAIDHVSVSRRHALVTIEEHTVLLEDLGSANGTWVGGAKLAPQTPRELRPDVLCEIGSVVLVLREGLGEGSSTDAKRSVVADPRMEGIYQLLDLAAQSDLVVLLLGETGVGKEVLASYVHERSKRSKGPFIRINCATLGEALLEAELFGYERGAFTGAQQAKPGLFEAADGGTIFLDEVGEMPLVTQAKVLRVIESGELTRLGSVKPRKVDVRIVCATNRDLGERIESGTFRQDLYFRLDGVSAHVPPLRERRADIVAIAEHFLREACAAGGRAPMTLAEDAVAALLAHGWPGNVRELKNVIARSVVFARDDALRAANLRFEGIGARPPAAMPTVAPPSPTSSPSVGDDDERARIERALDECVGNQTRAAKLLGISRRTLLNRLDLLGMPRPRKQG